MKIQVTDGIVQLLLEAAEDSQLPNVRSHFSNRAALNYTFTSKLILFLLVGSKGECESRPRRENNQMGFS